MYNLIKAIEKSNSLGIFNSLMAIKQTVSRKALKFMNNNQQVKVIHYTTKVIHYTLKNYIL